MRLLTATSTLSMLRQTALSHYDRNSRRDTSHVIRQKRHSCISIWRNLYGKQFTGTMRCTTSGRKQRNSIYRPLVPFESVGFIHWLQIGLLYDNPIFGKSLA